MSELISIVMPAFNAARFLPCTLASVQQQTWPHWELLLVDDGSTDDTRQVVAEYAALDSRIKYLYQPNGRQGKARNLGLRAAKGKYVAFLDADDYWLPDLLARQFEYLQLTSADMVFCDAYVFSDDSQLTPATLSMLPLLSNNKEPQSYTGLDGIARFLLGNRVPILTALVKRESLERVKGFGEDLLFQNAEDYHLWVKLLLEGFTLSEHTKPLAAYRKHTNSVSDPVGANLMQVVEAKIDLSEKYSTYKAVIRASLPPTMAQSLAEVSRCDDNRFYEVISHYLSIVNRGYINPVFQLLKLVKAKKLALRVSYFIFNRVVI